MAEAVKVYLAEVQELLRMAERKRAAAQARTEEARKTARYERHRQFMATLAGALLLLVTIAISFAVFYSHAAQRRPTTAAPLRTTLAISRPRPRR